MTRPTLSDDYTCESDLLYDAADAILTGYAQTKRIIIRIEKEISVLDRQCAELERQMAYGIDLRPPAGVANYSGMPGANNYDTPMERACEMAENRLQRTTEVWAQKRDKRDGLRLRLFELQEEVAPTEGALMQLPDEGQTILQLHYIDSKGDAVIAQQFNYSERTMRRRRRSLVLFVASVLEVVAEKRTA